MFESLSDRLSGALDKLTGRTKLSEGDVDAAMREIRIALLEADVALPVVKAFISRVKEEAIGQDIIKSVSPGQQVVKIVNDAIVDMLGAEVQTLDFSARPPIAYLMVGLQGSGKTTSTAKLAYFLKKSENKKLLMVSLDTYRPAAQEQLEVLGQQIDVDTLPIIKGQSPLEIAKRAMDESRKGGYDIIMLDTAGRLSIDDTLMKEVEQIRDLTNPLETLLVADSMTGQDAVTTAQNFNDRIGVTGIILTRVDGDARGGAAMSMRAITGRPVKFIGTGEKWDALEPFYPDRVASRILGMGDVVGLVEKASQTFDEEQAQKMADKFQKGEFDFDDYLNQLQSMKKMGGMGSLMKMIPGIGKMASMLDENNLNDDFLKKQEAIIQSMTKKERAKPAMLNASRRKRIAAGSGTSVPDVNKLVKQHQHMHGMMKKMRKMGLGGMMQQMKGLLGGQGDQLMEELGKMSPGADMTGGMDAFKDLQKAGGSSNPAGMLGSGSGGFPGLPGAGLPGLGGGALPPGLGGMGGMPDMGGSKRGVTKKIKKRKKK